MNQEQIAEIMTPDLMNELAAMETREEVQAALKGKGIDITLEEIDKIRQTLEDQLSGHGELTEEQLESVAGGSAFTDYFVGLGKSITYWARKRW